MVAERADFGFDDHLPKLNRGLKATALVVAVALAAAMGVAAATFDPQDKFGSDDAEQTVYRSASVGVVTDAACTETKDGLWRCAYQRDEYRCVGFVAENRGFDPGRCDQP